MENRKQYRMLNKDGSFNIHRVHFKRRFGTDLYHRLLAMKWHQFFLTFVLVYLLINVVFGLAYYACGPQSFDGAVARSNVEWFGEAFFFSIQTFATIGYGKVSPIGLIPNLIVTIEAIAALISVALSTGLFFARFSRPTAKVLFSEVATISKHDGQLSFVFRMANERLNQIVDATVDVVLVRTEYTAEGERFRNFYDLKLERNRSPLFAVSWLIVHAIDATSPFYNQTRETLRAQDTEIIISLTGIDETFAQTIHARHSYVVDEIIWGGYFQDILKPNDEGKLVVELADFHKLKPVTEGKLQN